MITIRLAPAMALWAFGASGIASAELLPSASLSATASDNSNRQNGSGSDDTQLALRAGLYAYHDGSLWDIEARVSTERLEYSDKTLPADTRGWLQLRTQVLLLPDRLSWELLDDYGQIATNPFGSLRPVDLQDVNFVSTGPDITLPAGEAGHFELAARYSMLKYSVLSDQDNSRVSADMAFVHRLSSIRNVGATGSVQRVNFKQGTSVQDYDLNSVSAVYSSAPRRAAVTAQLGLSQIKYRQVNDSKPLVMLAVERRLSASSELGVMLRHGFADGADSIRFAQSGGASAVLTPQNVRVTAAPFLQSTLAMDYVSRTARRSFALTPFVSREDYDTNAQLARRNLGVNLSASFSLTAKFSAGFDAYVGDSNYADSVLDARDYSVGVTATRSLSRSISLNAHAERYDRGSSTTDFEEMRYSLVLSYAKPSELLSARVGFMARTRGLSGQPTRSFRPELPSNE